MDRIAEFEYAGARYFIALEDDQPALFHEQRDEMYGEREPIVTFIQFIKLEKPWQF